jgi:GntR family transcriptional regulator
MQITIDPTAAAPVSEQISEGIRFAVATGRVAPGDRLPSVRGLARDLVVNPNTVAKVYRDLEREGVVRTRAGSGVFVDRGARLICRKASVAAVQAAVQTAVEKGLAAGLDGEALAEVLLKCLNEAGVTDHVGC